MLRETVIIDIFLHVLLPTCVVLLQAAHTFYVSVVCVHVVFDDKHVLMCACACFFVLFLFVCLFLFLMLIMNLFLGLLVSISAWFV